MASASGYDIGPCLVPDYISQLPFDLSATGAFWDDETNYNTGYSVHQDANGRTVVRAPAAELGEEIEVVR